MQVIRYAINGVVATVAHYLALKFLFETLRLPSAGLANALAACLGILVSFIGSRVFVFHRADQPILGQASRFVLIYLAILLINSGVLFLWTDLYGLDYRSGFAIAMVLQVIGSYFGNRYLVFA